MKTKKYITDNILNLIVLDEKIIIDLYQTFEFKRLGRINHLGMTNFLFPTSTHTRLSHSLGVYEIARRIMKQLSKDNEIDEHVITSIKIAALLHDIGHGIYSHVFELVSKKEHEYYSIKIIESEETEINKVIRKYNPDLIKDVVDLLRGKHKFKWANQIISSEIDADRLDYLQRDSIMTGTNFGKIELDWLIKNAEIRENNLVLSYKCLSSIEKMIIARFHMNQAVYNNPKNVSNSQLFVFFIERLKFLFNSSKLIFNYEKLEPILKNKIMKIKEFLELDDYSFFNYLLKARNEKDELLKKISNQIICQIPPKFIIENGSSENKIKRFDENLENQNWSFKNLKFDFSEYQSKRKDEAKIFINEKIENIREVSTLIKNTNSSPTKKKIWIYI